MAIRAVMNWQGQTILHFEMEKLSDIEDFCTAVETVRGISRRKSTRVIDIIVSLAAPRLVSEEVLSHLAYNRVLQTLRDAKLRHMIFIANHSSLLDAFDHLAEVLMPYSSVKVDYATSLDAAHELVRIQ
jgi:hypothetical protein